MSEVRVTVEETQVDGPYGNEIPGVLVTCTRCEHAVEVAGTSERSAKRGCIMLRESCPEMENNFYVITDVDDRLLRNDSPDDYQDPPF